jgi:hypothetical protein
MLHILDSSDSSDDSEKDDSKKGSWLAAFWADFRRRFISLLGMQFRSFSPGLALSVLQNKVYKQERIGDYFTNCIIVYYIILPTFIGPMLDDSGT